MRSYTLAEIDEIRALVREREVMAVIVEDWDGSPRIASPGFRSGLEPHEVEDLVRTLLAGSVDPAELRAEVRRRRDEVARLHLWRDAERGMDQRICGATTGHEFVPCVACAEASRRYARGRAYSDLCSRHRYGIRVDAAECKHCGAQGRRRVDRGRPGGRRSTDEPRTPVDDMAEVAAEPAPRRWWRFW